MTKEQLRQAATSAGFDLCGVARAGRAPHAEALVIWLQADNHGAMEWMRRTADLRCDPVHLLPGAKSVVVLATNYYRQTQPETKRDRGRFARYAWGADYHEVLAPRMERLAALLASEGGRQKCFVDGGPVLERDWAAASGISWHGKSTMGIHPKLGTWFFLSVILTTLDFDPDKALPDRCGSCTRCIDSCPTQAITAPYILDARRCISYLTIENKAAIPLELREAIGDRIFGCDDCLDACPWNRFAQAAHDAQSEPSLPAMDKPMREYLSLDDKAFKELFHGSAVLRTKRRGFLRNVCVALGNKGGEEDIPALRQAAIDHEPLVREHAEWALTRIADRMADGGIYQPRCSTESR
ncbi:MAG: tRNA epoxyqueuosine(34) reductase QueG [Chthoniobacterales bacterium]